MSIRPAREDEIDRLVGFPVDPAVPGVSPDAVRADFEQQRMRPQWAWVIEDDGHLLGRALWWGRADSAVPLSLDALDLAPGLEDPVGRASELLRAGLAALTEPGSRPPEYTVRVPQGWREQPEVAAAARWRIEAAHRVGLSELLERLQYAWAPADGLAQVEHRLRFRPGSDEEFLRLFEAVARGSLDVETVRGLQAMSPQDQARDDLEFYRDCPGERDWWAVAEGPDGQPVGFVVPSATPYHRNVGYLGVLPAHRGRGHVDALLHEITRRHLEAGADLITATTDTTNAPMAAAFDRAGYRITEVRLVLGPAPEASSG